MASIASRFLKISELANQTGLPISTIRHYINEGLLGRPRKTARNMAWYDQESLPTIRLVKRLQDEFYLPIKVIKKLLKSYEEISFEDYELIVEVRKRLATHTDLIPEPARIPHSEVVANLNLSEEEIDRLGRLGVISPEGKGQRRVYNEMDFRLLKSFSEVRASGFDEELGFGVEDLDFYLVFLKKLARIEARLFTQRTAKDRSVDEIVELIRKGLPAVNEVIAGLHHKLMLEELKSMEKDAKGKRERS